MKGARPRPYGPTGSLIKLCQAHSQRICASSLGAAEGWALSSAPRAGPRRLRTRAPTPRLSLDDRNRKHRTRRDEKMRPVTLRIPELESDIRKTLSRR